MRKSNHHLLRSLLREHDDGLTVAQMATMTQIDPPNVLRALKCMADIYRDRWQKSSRQYVAVWCAVKVPPNCPHPDHQGDNDEH